MADIQSNIKVNLDTSNALESLKNLQRQISAFQKQMQASSAANAASAQDLQRSLIGDINATGKFAARMQTLKSTTESFTTALEKNKLSMGEYFRYSLAGTKSFGRGFVSEFNTIEKVARERVKTLQTQYISLGRDANGALNGISVRPLTLDLNNLATQQAINAQKQQIFNQLLKQGSTNLLNFGKNTQWAGRQLMVGFTIPLSVFGSTAAKAFMELEEQTIRFKRVYGDLMTPSSEGDAMIEQIKTLGEEYTKYGVAIKDTMGLAADAAAMGKQGADLTAQVTEATRLAVLGNVSQQQALETSISITNAFGVSTADLAGKIDFLNAVENQTVTSIEDLTEAIPKAGPVVQQLGGDVEDLAFFLTAMKEGGVNASEGANALKSGLASLINPSQKAADMLKTYGVNLREIVSNNAGDVKGTVVDFAKALDTLDPLTRARAIEQLFGKFQFSRISTLFQNVIAEGSQASKVLELMGATTSELSALSTRELKTVEESITYRFKGAIEEFKGQLAPVGEQFMKLVTPLIEFGSKVLETFNNMGDHAKGFITGTIAVLGGLAPVALMTFGLVANGVANLVKGFQFLRNIFMGVSNSQTVLGEQTGYLTDEQLRAAAVAASLEQTHSRLPQIFTAEASAVDMLAAAYDRADKAGQRFASRPIPTTIGQSPAVKKFASGGFVSGSGNGDTVPAMLTPGEFVVKKSAAQKMMPFLQAINDGTLPGFNLGGEVLPVGSQSGKFMNANVFAHIGDSLTMTVDELVAALEKAAKRVPPALKEFQDSGLGGSKVRAYGGLGFTTSQEFNESMKPGRSGVDPSSFIADFQGRDLNKWKDSLKIAGLSMEDVSGDLRLLDNELLANIKRSAELDDSFRVTDEYLTKITTDTLKKLEANGSKLAAGFKKAADTVTEYRAMPTAAEMRDAGLTQSTENPKYFTTPGGRSQKAGRGPKKVRRDVGGIGFTKDDILDAQTVVAARKAGQDAGVAVINEATRGIKDSTKQASPSKEAYDAGRNIGLGAIQGIESTIPGARRPRRASQAAQFASSGSVGSVWTKDAKSGNVVTNEKLAKIEAGRQAGLARAAGMVTASMSSLSQKAMAASGAISTVAMVASMAGVELGGFGDALFMVSNSVFAFSSILEVLTKGKMFSNALQGGMAAKSAIQATGGMLAGPGGKVANLFGNMGKIVSGVLPALGKFGSLILRFLPGIGLVVAAFTAFQIVAKIMEDQKKRIEGLGDTAFLTSEKMKKAGELLNFTAKSADFSGAFAGTAAGSDSAQQTSITELRANDQFKGADGFGTQIEAVKNATKAQAELSLKSLSVQMAASGAPKEAVDTLVKAIAQEAGRRDLNLEFTSVDISTQGGQQEMASLAADASAAYRAVFKKEFDALDFSIPKILWFDSMAGQTEAMKQSVEQTSGVYSTLFQSLKSGFESGQISAEQFNLQMANISSGLDGLDPNALAMIVPTIAKNLGLDEQLKGVTDFKDQLMFIKAATAGVNPAKMKKTADLIKKASETGNAKDIKAAAAAKLELNELTGKAVEIKQKENEALQANADIEEAMTSADEKMANLRNQIDAYKTLTAQGFSSAEAQALAGDAMWATAIAAAKAQDAITGTDTQLQAVLTKMRQLKNLEGQASKLGIGGGGGGGAAEKTPFQKAIEQLKDQRSEVSQSITAYGKLTRAGVSTGTAFAVAQDKILAAAVASTKVGSKQWKQLTSQIKLASEAAKTNALINFTRENNIGAKLTESFAKIAPFLSKLGLSLEDMESILGDKDLAQAFVDDLKDGVINSRRVKDAINSIPNKKRVEIVLNMSTPEGMETEFNKLYDQAMAKLDTQEARVEASYRDRERAAQDAVDRAQKNVDAIQESIDAIQTQVEAKQRDIELTIDRPIEELNKQVSALERSIEMNYNRPIADLQEESSAFAHDIELINKAEEGINKKYDEQKKKLEEIAQVNRDVLDADKSRLSIAQALSSGNASAAAAAMQQAQQEESAKAAERAAAAIDAARQNEIAGLRSAQGLSKAQIEQRQFEISQKVYNLELQKKAVEDQIVVIQDQIFGIEANREAKLIAIRNLEDEAYKIQVEQLAPATTALKLATDTVTQIENQKKAEIDAITAQRDKWNDAKLRIDEAKTAAFNLETKYKAALKIVEDIEAAWKKVGTATVAASTGTNTDKAVSNPKPDNSGNGNGTKTTGSTLTTAQINSKKNQITSLKNQAAGIRTNKTQAQNGIAQFKRISATKYKTEISELEKKISGYDYAIGQIGLSISMISGELRKAGVPGYANGGVVKGFAAGKFAMGTDTVPAMLTPGEFVMKRSAVQNFGVERMKAINTGTYNGESVYNYSVNVNVQTDSDPDKIAREVMTQIKRIDSQRIRGNRFNG